MQPKKRAAVIGAGPAGMMAAGTAGRRGLDVFLIEKNQRPGRKLMITGKGRCNITNYSDVEGLVAGVIKNAKFLYSAFHTFSGSDLVNFFEHLGLKTKVERGGRVFPTSDSAADVVDTLTKYLKQNKVNFIKGEADEILTRSNSVVGVKLKDGRQIEAESIIVATGGFTYPQTGSTGSGYQLARQCGHTINELKPALVPLEVKEDWVGELQGLSLKNVILTVYNSTSEVVYKDFGEMLFTHYGVSGPIVLSASSSMQDMEKEKYTMTIDLKPALSWEQLDRRIQRDFWKYSRKIFSNSLEQLLPKKLIPVIVKLSGIPADKPVNQITKKERESLGWLLKNLSFSVKKFRPLEEAIVTSGGVAVNEVNPSTMESRIVKGLFWAGEILDVHGDTGGYNLQIAFSTGYTAGLNC